MCYKFMRFQIHMLQVHAPQVHRLTRNLSYRFASSSVISSQVTPFSAISTIT